jgi:hypothetical protein
VLFRRVCTWRGDLFEYGLRHDADGWMGRKLVLAVVDRPLAGAEMARCKAAAAEGAVRAGVLVAVVHSTTAERWSFDDNEAIVLVLLGSVLCGGYAGVRGSFGRGNGGGDVSICRVLPPGVLRVVELMLEVGRG